MLKFYQLSINPWDIKLLTFIPIKYNKVPNHNFKFQFFNMYNDTIIRIPVYKSHNACYIFINFY